MVTVRISGGSGVESSSTDIPFTVSLSAPSSEPITVSYRAVSGTAQGTASEDFYGLDYYGTRTLTFNPGETSKVITADVRSDNAVEFDEAVVMELVDAVNATFADNALSVSATGWILDDDGVANKRALYVSDAIVTEGDSGSRTATFEVSISSPLSVDRTFSYTTIAGSAKPGSDYVQKTGSVSFFAGQTRAFVSVQVNGDNAAEVAETFFLKVNPTPEIGAGHIGSVGKATILDDDAPAGPTISISGGTAPESSSSDLPFMVRLSAPSSEVITVDYRAVSGTARAEGSEDFYGLDYYGTRTLTFNPGETSKVITTDVRSDNVVEFDETVVMELVNPVNASFVGRVGTVNATGWILDDDTVANRRSVFISNPTVAEQNTTGASQAVFDISLSRPSSETITLRYATIDQTAKAGRDYQAKSGSIVFEPGQTETSITVPILSDGLREGTESFVLRILPPFPVQIAAGSPAAFATASILDATVIGSSLSETLVGDEIADTLYGLGGSDFIYGLAGNDRIFGGGGNDRLYGGNGNDRMYGQGGNDILNGGRGNDDMRGGAGNDVYVVDSAGDKVVEAARQGFDRVESAVSYRLAANVENLTLLGGGGLRGDGNGANNVIRGNSGANVLTGANGGDALYGNNGNDRMYGQGGNDRLYGGVGRDLMVGGNGNDLLNGGGWKDDMRGGAGNDVYVVDSAGDKVVEAARQGFDRVESAVSYRLAANVENLTLLGGGGLRGDGNGANNVIRGNSGANVLTGANGDDALYGNNGNDRMYGQGGNDRLYGGVGRDLMVGGNGNDLLNGGGWKDDMRGGNGNDRLYGGGGTDRLYGNDGNDDLTGNSGADVLVGGRGSDDFIFRSRTDSTGAARDLIDGFEGAGRRGGDRIDVSGIDAVLGQGGNQKFVFGDSQAKGHLWAKDLRGGDTMIYGNIDNDRAAEIQIRIADGGTTADNYYVGDFIL